MPFTDLAVDELRRYRPELAEPADFDAFWTDTLTEARGYELALSVEPMDTGLALVDTYDVRYAGYGGSPVAAWLHLPAVPPRGATGTGLPVVVEYVGYGGGRGLAHERMLFALAGYAYLIMDTRGQGSSWSVGHTPDPQAGTAGPAFPGFMTKGIHDPADHYYRRVFTDAVRAVDAARALPEVLATVLRPGAPTVDASRIAVTGGSQGGAITLAVAGLVDGLAAAAPDVPFLSDFPRAVRLADSGPYQEIAAYLKVHRDQVDRVFATLAYFDVALHARRANAPTLFSVGLMDATCPASTVYAAYNNYAGASREVIDYPFNDHEGGQGFHDVAKLRFLAAHLPDGSGEAGR
jgi:cephalosporin-C deacetylase